MDVDQNRGKFTSSIGFILAAAGSAIGLGNIWKFPYMAGENGGGLFLIFYILFTVIFGIPILLAEMSLGRASRLSPVGAFKSFNRRWSFVGWLSTLGSFVVLSYYSVVGGWVLKYIFSYAFNADFGNDKLLYFNNFIKNPLEPALWHLVFIILTASIVLAGVTKGIEKASKIMLPVLFIFILIIAIRSLMLDGALEGLKFLFVPNLSDNSSKSIIKSISQAMSQSFFSLSLGLGATITYGSYLEKDSNMQKDAVLISVLDTSIAVLSGIAVLPAVFSFGLKPEIGPGLIFGILPSIFESMAFSNIIGIIFFISIFLAAITSSISLLEVVTSLLIDNFNVSRHKAAWLMTALVAIVGIFASLSMGELSWIRIAGFNLFDFLSYTVDKILMPITALFTCIFIGYIVGIDNISKEIRQGANGFKLQRLFGFIMKYVAPVLIFVIFIMDLI